MELKINSFLQPDCISRDKLGVTAFVPFFPPKLNWILSSEMVELRMLGIVQQLIISGGRNQVILSWEWMNLKLWLLWPPWWTRLPGEQLQSVLETQKFLSLVTAMQKVKLLCLLPTEKEPHEPESVLGSKPSLPLSDGSSSRTGSFSLSTPNSSSVKWV